MPVEECLKFNGVCYGVGTKLKFYPHGDIYLTPITGVIEKFVNNYVVIRGEDNYLYEFSMMSRSKYHINPIIEIIQPVYYDRETTNYTVDNRVFPSEGDIDIGWVWYIIIMLVAVIFKDRIIIWLVASAIFFTWKNGFLNGGNK